MGSVSLYAANSKDVFCLKTYPYDDQRIPSGILGTICVEKTARRLMLVYYTFMVSFSNQ